MFLSILTFICTLQAIIDRIHGYIKLNQSISTKRGARRSSKAFGTAAGEAGPTNAERPAPAAASVSAESRSSTTRRAAAGGTAAAPAGSSVLDSAAPAGSSVLDSAFEATAGEAALNNSAISSSPAASESRVETTSGTPSAYSSFIFEAVAEEAKLKMSLDATKPTKNRAKSDLIVEEILAVRYKIFLVHQFYSCAWYLCRGLLLKGIDFVQILESYGENPEPLDVIRALTLRLNAIQQRDGDCIFPDLEAIHAYMLRDAVAGESPEGTRVTGEVMNLTPSLQFPFPLADSIRRICHQEIYTKPSDGVRAPKITDTLIDIIGRLHLMNSKILDGHSLNMQVETLMSARAAILAGVRAVCKASNNTNTGKQLVDLNMVLSVVRNGSFCICRELECCSLDGFESVDFVYRIIDELLKVMQTIDRTLPYALCQKTACSGKRRRIELMNVSDLVDSVESVSRSKGAKRNRLAASAYPWGLESETFLANMLPKLIDDAESTAKRPRSEQVESDGGVPMKRKRACKVVWVEDSSPLPEGSKHSVPRKRPETDPPIACMYESNQCNTRKHWAEKLIKGRNVFGDITKLITTQKKDSVLCSDSSTSLPLTITCTHLETILGSKWISHYLIEFCMVYVIKFVTGGEIRAHQSGVYEAHPNGRGPMLVFSFEWYAQFCATRKGDLDVQKLTSWMKRMNIDWGVYKTWFLQCCTGTHYLFAVVDIKNSQVKIKDTKRNRKLEHARLYKTIFGLCSAMLKIAGELVDSEQINMCICMSTHQQDDDFNCGPGLLDNFFDEFCGQKFTSDYSKSREMYAHVIWDQIKQQQRSTEESVCVSAQNAEPTWSIHELSFELVNKEARETDGHQLFNPVTSPGPRGSEIKFTHSKGNLYLFNPVPYGMVQGNIEIRRKGNQEPRTQSILLSGSIHSVEAFGSCGYIVIAEAVHQASHDTTLKLSLLQIFDGCDFWIKLCTASNEIISLSKNKTLTPDQIFEMSTCKPIRQLLCQEMIDNPGLFVDVFQKECMCRTWTKRQIGLNLRSAGIQVTDELLDNKEYTDVLKWAVALLVCPENSDTWLDDRFSFVLTSSLKNKLAICTLQSQDDVIQFVSEDVHEDTQVIFIVKLGSMHFEMFKANNQSIFLFNDIASQLSKGRSKAKISDVSGHSIESATNVKEVGKSQRTIDVFFKPTGNPGAVIPDKHADIDSIPEPIQQMCEIDSICLKFKHCTKKLKDKSFYSKMLPEITNAGHFILKQVKAGAHNVLQTLIPIVHDILSVQISLNEKPFLDQSVVRSFVGRFSISPRMHASVCYLQSQATINRSNEHPIDSDGPKFRSVPFTGPKKIGYFADMAGKLSSTLAGFLEKHNPSLVNAFLIWIGPYDKLNLAQVDLMRFFSDLDKLLFFETDIQQIRSLNLHAVVDISDCLESDHLVKGLAQMNFVVAQHGELRHYHQDLVHYAIGARKVDDSPIHGKSRERIIVLESGLPPPIHGFFDLNNMTKEHFNLPPDGFLYCYASRPESVTTEQMSVFLRLLTEDGSERFLILIPCTDGPLIVLNDAVGQLQEMGHIVNKSRILIRPIKEHGPEYIALLGHVDLCLESCEDRLTTAAGIPVLCINNLHSNLKSLAAAEHMNALGLKMLVADSVEMFLEKGVHFANNKKLLKEMTNHILNMKRLFQENWINTLEEAILNGIHRFNNVEQGIFQDIHLKSSWAIPEFQDSNQSTRKRILETILITVKLKQREQDAILSIMKLIQESGNTLGDVLGIGGSTVAIKCFQTCNNDKPFAAKMDLRGVGLEHMLDSGCFRGAFNGALTEKKLLRKDSRHFIPMNICIFHNNSAFCGHTAPDLENCVHFFYCCEFIDCDPISCAYSDFQEQWQHHGTLTDKFRFFVLQLLQTINLMHSNKLCFLDVKPANLGSDQDGNILAVDLSSSISFSFSREERLGFPSAPPVLSLLEKRSKYLNIPLRGFKLADTGTVLFSVDHLDKIRIRLLDQNVSLSCVGIGTRNLYDWSESGLRNSTGNITETNAILEDSFQAAMVVLHIFRPPLPNKEDYPKLVSDASCSLEKMKEFMLPRQSDVKQEVTFSRFANLAFRALGPERMSLRAMLHDVATTLLVLDPEYDRLACNDGILFPGGHVRDLKCAINQLEEWRDEYIVPIRLKYIEHKGLGVLADSQLPPNTFVGFYVGKYLKDEDGMEFVHSRYVATLLSVRAKGKEWIDQPRFYCDAGPSEELTMKWFKENNIFCHWMNSETLKKANCRLDRRNPFVHFGLVWIPMYTKSKEIQKGEEMCWHYNDEAGHHMDM